MSAAVMQLHRMAAKTRYKICLPIRLLLANTRHHKLASVPARSSSQALYRCGAQ